MVLILSALLLSTTPVSEVRTELQVEAVKPPNRAAELSAELARAEAELAEAKAVAAALPDGDEKRQETERLEGLAEQIVQMRALVKSLPSPPKAPVVEAAPEPTPRAVQPAPPAPMEQPYSVLWIAISMGLIIGAFLAMALTFRTLPGRPPEGAMRVPQLAVLSALLAAVGPQLMRLGYDQPIIVLGWALLSTGAVLRMGLRRVRSQIERFALERAAAAVLEEEDE